MKEGNASPVDWAGWYETYRTQMFQLAYRLLGTVADAEDAVQDAFVSLQSSAPAPDGAIRHPKAYLSKAVANRCLNVLKSARRRRESYVGEWLPEPIVESRSALPHESAEMDESVSYAMLVLLQRLSPVERAVFVLREALLFEYAEVAEMLGKSEANCRQLFSRAKRKLADRISTPARLAAENALAEAPMDREQAVPSEAGGEAVAKGEKTGPRAAAPKEAGQTGMASAEPCADLPSARTARPGADRAEGRLGGKEPSADAPLSYAREEELVRRFVAAFRNSNVRELARLLRQDAVLTSDGGGKARAAIKPIYTRPRILALLAAMKSNSYLHGVMTVVRINGRPGFLIHVDGTLRAVVCFRWDAGVKDAAAEPALTDVYFIVNPDKLPPL
ncbi:sigma-70 family RNA polymerase sigma factor [Cohnella sp. REN36]|uniref:sigma-70 family RNA polymerase sigma factor n=1 Tax=Cohnella sp. REN36 TaxID=2887347 RepID=UPI001D142B41|nr:sigma-70 family RNA polymerase sigma factor [Cohnella sp. REN36]MCC3377231.1 sigma-70 family RNA polymerase sigma factor [Cohnella sp. REN36]